MMNALKWYEIGKDIVVIPQRLKYYKAGLRKGIEYHNWARLGIAQVWLWRAEDAKTVGQGTEMEGSKLIECATFIAKAEQILSQILEKDPHNIDAWVLLGNAKMEIKDFSGAEEAFEHVIDLNPQDDKGWNNLGRALASQGNRLGEIKALKRIVDLHPKDQLNWVILGNMQRSNGNLDEAIKTLETAVAIHPLKEIPWYFLGQDYLAAGRKAEALFCFERSSRQSLKEKNLAEKEIAALHEIGVISIIPAFAREIDLGQYDASMKISRRSDVSGAGELSAKKITNIPISLKMKFPTLSGKILIAKSVGMNGHAIITYASIADLAGVMECREKKEVVPKIKKWPERDFNLHIIVLEDNQSLKFTLKCPLSSRPLVQILPSGEILVVGIRCQLFETGKPEKNAKVFTSEGLLTRTFCLGDGIKDVQVSESGEIWVSYFDEGVYGNYGWSCGNALGPPIGAAGLACFNSYGGKMWEYNAPEGIGPIDSCYALNISGEEVWAYYYSDFPLVRVQGRYKLSIWRSPVAGSKAIVVNNHQVLFVGEYGQQGTPCTLSEIGKYMLKPLKTFNLLTMDGDPCEFDYLVGRGQTLHAFTNEAWYTLEIDNAEQNKSDIT